MHFIIDSKNLQKFEGLCAGVHKLLGGKFSAAKVITERMPDVRPLTKQEAIKAAKDGVSEVVRSYLKKDDTDKQSAIAVCLQKGTTLLDADTDPTLICIVAMRKTTDGPDRVFIEECRAIPLDPQVRTLVEGGMDIYKAYGIVYGEDVETKKKDLLEIICPQLPVTVWFAEGVFETLQYVV